LFCKIYDERFKGGDEYVEFFIGEEEEKTKEKIQNIFEKAKSEFFEVFDSQEFIAFSPSIIHYLVSRLQNISFMNSGGDAFADAFEAFIGKSMRGEHGQFFTPRNVIKFIVKLLGLEENDKVIDPACGTGGFLVETLRQV
jgi:type I restriction enzyme M protein